MEQAAANAHQVSTAEQQRARQEALVTAKEMAYQQLIADSAVDLHGLQAQALLAEMMRLHTELNNVH